MAQLDQLRPLFDEMSEAEQVAFIASYRRLRDVELESSQPVKTTRSSKEADDDLSDLTPAQRALLKKLGLKKRDLIRLMGGANGSTDQQ